MLEAGRRLGRYEIAALLGRGGMGEVYRARDTELDREVAVKVLPAHVLGDEAAQKRFRKEARALSRLAHPHVASLHDFGTVDGMASLVMELVPGATLESVLAKGPLAEAEVVRLGVQITKGLVDAHRHGVVHRDLKPANIRLTPDGIVKILDFGLARVEPSRDEHASTESASGVVAGTPPYMSPEQLLGRKVDERTDVYGAGAVLYQMATGRAPFAETKGPQLVAAILHEPPPLPREVNPGVTPALEAVILKAIDKDPGLRHQTAKDLLVDLERLALGAGESRAARRTGRGERPSPGLARGLALLAAVAVAAFALLRPREPRITAVRSLVQLPIGTSGVVTDGVDVYYGEHVRDLDRLMAVPIEGGEPREISVLLPREGNIGIDVMDIRRDPPALLLNRDGEMWRIPLPVGAPSRLVTEGYVPIGGADWSPGGDRLVWIEGVAGVHRLYAGDGEGKGAKVLFERRCVTGEAFCLVLSGLAPSGDRVRFARGDEPRRFFDVPVSGGTPIPVDTGPAGPQPLPHGFWGETVNLGAWSPGGRFFLLSTRGEVRAHPEGGLRWPWPRDLLELPAPQAAADRVRGGGGGGAGRPEYGLSTGHGQLLGSGAAWPGALPFWA